MGNNEDRVKNAYKKYTCMIKLWTCLAGSSNFTLEKYKKLKNSQFHQLIILLKC